MSNKNKCVDIPRHKEAITMPMIVFFIENFSPYSTCIISQIKTNIPIAKMTAFK